MAGRNTIWELDVPAGILPDGWRYHVETFPGGSALVDPERRTLPSNFVESFPVIDHQAEVTPIGVFDARGVSMNINLGFVDTDLFAFLTDDGVRVGVVHPSRTQYNLTINTVWIITTDEGIESRGIGDFRVLFIGVQRHYIGNTIKGNAVDSLTMDIELIDIGKVLFETIPIWEPGAPPWDNPVPNFDAESGPVWSDAERPYFTLEDQIRQRVEGMGGNDPTYTAIYRNRTYDLITHVIGDEGGLETLYAIMRHAVEDHSSDVGPHQYVCIRWIDILDAMIDVCNRLFTTIMRRPGETSIFLQHDPPVSGGSASFLDNVLMYREGYTDRAERGSLLTAEDLLLIAWVRKDTGTEDWDNQPVYGGAIASRTALAKAYTNLWDWWKDLANNCIVRGVYSYIQTGGSVSLVIRSTVLYSSSWQSEIDLPHRTIRDAEYKRGGEAGALAAATSTVVDPAPNSESAYAYEVSSMPQSLKKYDVQFALHTAPILPSDDDIYWVASPAPTAHEVLTQLDTDFGNVDQKIIFGTSMPNVQCFYYLATASWITSGDGNVVARVHHAVEILLGDVREDYVLPEGEQVLLPTVLRLASTWTDFESSDWRATFLKAWRSALIEIGRRSWMAQVSYIISRILGRAEQRSTTVTVRRRTLHVENPGVLQVAKFNPSDLIPITTNTTQNAVITGLKQDPGAGEDTIRLFNFAGDI